MGSPRYESEPGDVKALGAPLHFEYADKSAPNRFLKAAMAEGLSSWDPEDPTKRGIPSERYINLYRRWGEGGLGLILTGNIQMAYDQLSGSGDAIVPFDAPFSGERFDAFKKLAEVTKAHGALLVGQVNHPGRQVENRIQKHPISASDVQLKGNVMGMFFEQPRPANDDDIKHLINSFAHTAEYLEKAGFDGIQLHGAHGYLLAQFLSPTTNHRTDNYGGSLENRARIILEIATEIRRRVSKNFILGIKLNSVEFQDKGFEPAEARKLCAMLEEHKFDFVELSGGTYEQLAFTHKRESTKKREAFFLEFADQIAPALTKTKTYVTGGLRTVGAMTEALKSVDGIGLGRPVAQEPHLAKDILEGKVQAAIVQRLDQDNFGLTNVAAGTQMRQIGKDQNPIDLSDEANEQAFVKDMGSWMEKLQADSKMLNWGYVDISSAAPVPYGTA